MQHVHSLRLYSIKICVCIVCIKNIKIWEFSFNLDYKRKTVQDRHILFIHTWWYQVRRLPEEDDLLLVFHTHIHTHSQWGSEADMSDRLSSQILRERNIVGWEIGSERNEERDDYEPVKCEGNVLSSTFIFSHASLFLR